MLGNQKITYTLGGKEFQITLSSAVNKKIGANMLQSDTAYVQNIDDLSCINQSFIKSIYIPNNICELPDGFLSNAINLEYIYFDVDKTKPKLTKIGANAFYKSFKLRNLSFPDSLAEIGTNAFHDCINLKSIFFGKRRVNYNKQTTFNADMLYINHETIAHQVQDNINSYTLSVDALSADYKLISTEHTCHSYNCSCSHCHHSS